MAGDGVVAPSPIQMTADPPHNPLPGGEEEPRLVISPPVAVPSSPPGNTATSPMPPLRLGPPLQSTAAAAHTNHCQPPIQSTAGRPDKALPAAQTEHCAERGRRVFEAPETAAVSSRGATEGSKKTRRGATEITASLPYKSLPGFSLPEPLLACVAQKALELLNAPSAAPIVERRTADVDWDFFLMVDGSGGEDGEGADRARNPSVHRKALLEQLCSLRLVCRSWRDAIGGELVATLYLNRCNLESKCWWPSTAMGRVTKASQFIKTAPLPQDFAVRFAGLRRLTLANLRMKFVPEQLQGLPLTHLNLSGNTLESLPHWFGSLPLRELQLGDPWTGSWADGSPSRQMLRSLGEWLNTADECALPHTLQHLSLADTKGLTQLPKAVRRMESLESLDIHCTTCSIEKDDYLTQLPLRELVLLNSPSAPPNVPAWAARLSRIEKLVLSNEVAYDHVDDETFAQSLITNLRATFCLTAGSACPSQPSLSRALRCLRLEDLQLEQLPESLRSLVALEELNLSGWSVLHRLPDWLCELPLRKILVNSCFSLESRALPSNFAAMESLRELHLLFVGNIVGTSLGVDLSGAVGLDCVERNLGPLSRSRPELRFRVLSEISTREPGVSLCLEPAYGFWTAAAGLDCEEIAVANIALAFCDVCNTPLRFGNWWHKNGAGYDLCCKHYCEHKANSLHSEGSEYLEVTSEQQIEDNRSEFSEYLRNSQITPLQEEVEDQVQVETEVEGAGGNLNDNPQPIDVGADSDDDDDDDAGEAHQMFLDINDFIEHGLHGLHADVWLAADEEMVEVTAPTGEGDGDHILQ